MRNKKNRWCLWSSIAVTCLMTLACGLFSGIESNQISTTTPTPTEIHVGGERPETTGKNSCENLSGKFELQILIGPAEAAGLQPYTVAEIPFVVVNEENQQTITGDGPVQYYEDILEAEWGSFTVTFDGDTTVTGECQSIDQNGLLHVNLAMEGNQTIEVVVEGMTTTYPWEGSPRLEASFPIEEGAQNEGEGWLLILHLD